MNIRRNERRAARAKQREERLKGRRQAWLNIRKLYLEQNGHPMPKKPPTSFEVKPIKATVVLSINFECPFCKEVQERFVESSNFSINAGYDPRDDEVYTDPTWSFKCHSCEAVLYYCQSI